MLLRRLLSSFGTIKQFTELQVLNKYLEVNHFPYVLVYFTAKWNPACKITDEHMSLVSNRFNDIEIIKVDSDVSPQITSHYNVRAEPEFVFCLNGDEIIRQTGPNKEKLLEKCEMMLEIGKKGSAESKWTPFGTKFETFYKSSNRTKQVAK